MNIKTTGTDMMDYSSNLKKYTMRPLGGGVQGRTVYLYLAFFLI